MKKKIESMEDYLGIAKKKFEQMKTDAEFYKDKQEELSLAQRKLKSGGKLFTNYIAEILYKEKTYKVNPSASPSAFLTGVTDYKSDTLKNNENYIKEREELGEEFRESSMGFSNAVRTQTSEVKNDRDVKALSTTQCSELLKKGEEFCRKYKQEIKDIFEEEMKKFSKEKTALKELNDLIKKFNLSKKFDEIITAWHSVSDWYNKNCSTLIDKEQNPVTQVYTKALDIAKEKVPKAIGQHIKTEFTGICEALKKINRLYTQRSDIPNSTLTAINQSKDLFNYQIDEYKKLCSELGNKEMVETLKEHKENIRLVYNQALVVNYAIGSQDTKIKDK